CGCHSSVPVGGSTPCQVPGPTSKLPSNCCSRRDAKVRRFIYAASSSAYGESEKLPKEESMASSPLSPYAVQKLAGENYCSVFATCYGMQTLSMRYFNVFGPRQDPGKPVCRGDTRSSSPASFAKNYTVYGNGE
ncbi:MAG: NAD-dependent epimerase/dehydratase family protein, partial [Planctomycetes bacterium]|nr:NAD-dependent epimerase/dehydratase family protein [Planctomycetota bacterium]